MAKRKRIRRPEIVPPIGPAVNLRPAGAHDSPKTYNRKREKAALREEIESGFRKLNTPAGETSSSRH